MKRPFGFYNDDGRVQKTRPSICFIKKRDELSTSLQKNDIQKANKMIEQIIKQTQSMDAEGFSQLEKEAQTPGILKKIAIGTLALFTATYAANATIPNAYAQGTGTTSKGNISVYGTGLTSDGQKVFGTGTLKYTEDGQRILQKEPGDIAPIINQQPQNNTNSTIQPKNKSPTFNYKTAKQYIDKAVDAYKQGNPQDVINISTEARYRVDHKEIKASPEELKRIDHLIKVGYEVKRNSN